MWNVLNLTINFPIMKSFNIEIFMELRTFSLYLFGTHLLIFNLLERVLEYSNYQPQTKHRLARIERWFASASDCVEKGTLPTDGCKPDLTPNFRANATWLPLLFLSSSRCWGWHYALWHEPVHSRQQCQYWQRLQQRVWCLINYIVRY